MEALHRRRPADRQPDQAHDRPRGRWDADPSSEDLVTVSPRPPRSPAVDARAAGGGAAHRPRPARRRCCCPRPTTRRWPWPSTSSGRVRAFVALMNRRAGRARACADTRFASPNGLDDRGYSTARDLATLTSSRARTPAFRIAGRHEDAPTWRVRRAGRIAELQNRNAMLGCTAGAFGVQDRVHARRGGLSGRDGDSATAGTSSPWCWAPRRRARRSRDSASLLNYGFTHFRPRATVAVPGETEVGDPSSRASRSWWPPPRSSRRSSGRTGWTRSVDVRPVRRGSPCRCAGAARRFAGVPNREARLGSVPTIASGSVGARRPSGPAHDPDGPAAGRARAGVRLRVSPAAGRGAVA